MAVIKVLESKRIYEGKIFSVRSDRVDFGNGCVAVREVAEHGGAVCVLPVDENGTVYLVRQYRHAAGRDVLEAPAGGMEPGETPEEAALRELREETGASGTLIPMGEYLPTPGYCSEKIYLFCARVTGFGETDFDEDEFLSTETYPFAEFYQMARDGRISDGKTIAAALRADGLWDR